MSDAELPEMFAPEGLREEHLRQLPRLVIVAGPTGVGKTAFSLTLAERLGGEIVCADSLQIYRHLDIGTAKPTPSERSRAAHHLFDLLDPNEDFNVGMYRELAGKAIADILGRGRVPIVTGGTGLYIRLLVHGLLEAPPPSPELRARYQLERDTHGVGWLHERLRTVDPVLAVRVDPNDFVRISRGLEVFDQTGQPLSAHQSAHRFRAPAFHALKIAIVRPRPELHARLDARVDAMIADGLREEYAGLIARGYTRELKPLMSLGYKQMGAHTFEALPLDAAIEDIKRQTRRYARQQVSWLKKEPGVRWLRAPQMTEGAMLDGAVSAVGHFMQTGQLPGGWAESDLGHLLEGDGRSEA